MDAIFNQRVARTVAETFYFQLVPNLLTVDNPALVKTFRTANPEFRLKIIKGTQISDEMKKGAAVKPVNGKAAFEKIQLNFNLPSFNPNRNIEFVLILLKYQQGQQETELGRYSIGSTPIVTQFKDQQTRYHKNQVKIGADFTLSFDLFIDNSRFALEKFIKEYKDEIKQDKMQDILKGNSRKSINKELTSNVAKSEAISDKQKVEVVMHGEERFISPTRRIIRKQSENRRVLTGTNATGVSPQNSQDGSSNGKRNLRFLSRNTLKQQTSPPKIISLAEQEAAKMLDKIKQQQNKRKADQQKQRQLQREKQAAEAQSKKVEAEKAEQRKKQAENRKLEAQRKRQEEQAARKSQETRRAAEQKRLETQRKRQQQRQRKIQNEKQQQLKKQTEQRKQKLAKSREEQKKTQTEKKRQEQENKFKEQLWRELQSQHVVQKKVSNNTSSPKNPGPIAVRKTLSLAPKTSQENWDKPVSMKMTDSATYDEKGRMINESKIKSAANSKKQDPKSQIFIIVFLVISALLILNAMSPSSKL